MLFGILLITGFFVSILKGKFDPISDHNINEYIKHLHNLTNGDETPQPSAIKSLDPVSLMR